METTVVRKPTDEELTYMSQTELEKYIAITNEVIQLKKAKIVAEHKLMALKIIVNM